MVKRMSARLSVMVWGGMMVFTPAASAAPHPFAPDRWELRTGYGYQYNTNERPTHFDLVPVLPSAMWYLTDLMGPSWLRGRWSWNPELFLATFSHPYMRPLIGATPLQFQYSLKPMGRWAPYGFVGAGVLWSHINRVETDSDVNFNLQGGLGARFSLSDRTAILAEYRHIHLSNSGLGERNSGLNTHTFLVGLSIAQ